MNNYQEKMNFREEGNTITIQPNLHRMRAVVINLIIAVGILFTYQLFKSDIDEEFGILSAVVTGIFFVLAAYVFLFKARVSYVFDKNEMKVYRQNPLLGKKELFPLDHIEIFTTSGDEFYYSFGEKDNQFVKNYRLGKDLSGYSNKKFEQRVVDFEEQIVNPIVKLAYGELAVNAEQEDYEEPELLPVDDSGEKRTAYFFMIFGVLMAALAIYIYKDLAAWEQSGSYTTKKLHWLLYIAYSAGGKVGASGVIGLIALFAGGFGFYRLRDLQKEEQENF